MLFSSCIDEVLSAIEYSAICHHFLQNMSQGLLDRVLKRMFFIFSEDKCTSVLNTKINK